MRLTRVRATFRSQPAEAPSHQRPTLPRLGRRLTALDQGLSSATVFSVPVRTPCAVPTRVSGRVPRVRALLVLVNSSFAGLALLMIPDAVPSTGNAPLRPAVLHFSMITSVKIFPGGVNLTFDTSPMVSVREVALGTTNLPPLSTHSCPAGLVMMHFAASRFS